MTVPFRIMVGGKPDEALEKKFVDEADKKHMLKELKGHRSVGGLRASIFNAVSFEEVKVLVDFMTSFKDANQVKAWKNWLATLQTEKNKFLNAWCF